MERKREKKGEGGGGRRDLCGPHMSVGPATFLMTNGPAYIFLILMPLKRHVNAT
jgi:hypothetical protein